jgi:hypothetical protein
MELAEPIWNPAPNIVAHWAIDRVPSGLNPEKERLQ